MVQAPHRRGSVISLDLYNFLAWAARLIGSNLLLKGPYSITIPFTYVILDVFPKDDDGVIVLFHTTLGALDACLEPFHNTLGVEHVFAFEFLIVPLGLLKTHSTCAGKVYTTHSVFDRPRSALLPVPFQG
jgi:hypothetical protein